MRYTRDVPTITHSVPVSCVGDAHADSNNLVIIFLAVEMCTMAKYPVLVPETWLNKKKYSECYHTLKMNIDFTTYFVTYKQD